MPAPRYVQMVHAVPGRTRVRLSWLRQAPEDVPALADHLATLPGMQEVRIRARTGSVLCFHDKHALSAADIERSLIERTGVMAVPQGAKPPPGPPLATSTSLIATHAARFFHELNQDLLQATSGQMDLGTAAACSFLAAGGLEVAVKREIPAPPWFNLAWWAFRMFMVLENEAIRKGNGSGS